MSNDTLANVPATVCVSFPRQEDGIALHSRYAVDVTLASLALPQYAGFVGRTGKQLISSDAVYETGANDNYAEILLLAQALATDFYLWKLAFLELRLASYIAVEPEGLHDLEFVHDAGMTVVHRTGWEPDIGSLRQAGDFGSYDPGSEWIRSINDDTTSDQTIGFNIAGDDLSVQKVPTVWLSTVAYVIGDLVTNDGSIWRASADNINDEPPSGNWDDVTLQVDISWIGGFTYERGWLVTYLGSTWRSIVQNTSDPPPSPSWVECTDDGINVLNVPRIRVYDDMAVVLAKGDPHFRFIGLGISITGSDPVSNELIFTVNGEPPVPAACGDIMVGDLATLTWKKLSIAGIPDGYVLTVNRSAPYCVSWEKPCCDETKQWYCLEAPATYPGVPCCPEPVNEVLTLAVISGGAVYSITMTYAAGVWVGSGSNVGSCVATLFEIACVASEWTLTYNGTDDYIADPDSVYCAPLNLTFKNIDLTACGLSATCIAVVYE